MLLKFLVVGGTGFLIDTTVTYVLIRTGVDARIARLPAIATAIAFTWLANRQFTYAATRKRSLSEALRYVAVAAVMASLNYLLYVLLLKLGIWPTAAITISTLCQTGLSFHAYRYFVFSEKAMSATMPAGQAARTQQLNQE